MKNLLSVSIFIFISIVCSSQVFTNYTTADGLIDNSVNCVAVGANDVVWFGTQNGISSFDGTSWNSYSTATDTVLVDDNIKTIAVMSNGDVWVGTDFGASKYDGSSWQTFTEADGLADNRVNDITQEANGNIWLGNYDGVSVFDGTSFTSYTMADGLPFGGVTSTTFDSSGDKWFGSGLGGLIKFDGTSFTIFNKQNDNLISNNVRSVEVSSNDNKWVGTADGISVFNNNDLWSINYTTMYALPPPDTLNPVVDIEIDANGNIWAGIYVDYLVTEGGVAIFDGNYWISYDVSDGLIGPVIRDLAINSQNYLWVATSTGVSKISNIPALISQVDQDSFILYPNPTKGNFSIISNNKNISKIEIYNALGQKINTFNNIDSNTIINLNSESNIYYFIKIYDQTDKLIGVERLLAY